MGLFSNKKNVNHYRIPAECGNCGNVGQILAARGIKKEDAVKDDVCNHCGCGDLKLLTDQEYHKKQPPKASGGLFD